MHDISVSFSLKLLFLYRAIQHVCTYFTSEKNCSKASCKRSKITEQLKIQHMVLSCLAKLSMIFFSSKARQLGCPKIVLCVLEVEGIQAPAGPCKLMNNIEYCNTDKLYKVSDAVL